MDQESEINEGSMRLDAEPSDIQSNPTPDGAPRDRVVCFPVDEAAIQILQLETRPRGTRDRCIPSGLVSDERICQSPVVSHSSLSGSNKARVVMVTPLWPSQPLYLTILGMLEDFPRMLSAQDDLVVLQTDQAFIMNQGAPVLVAWPISANPLHQEELMQRLQISCFHPGDQKLSQTTIHCLQNGLAGVNKGIGIPFRDLYRTS